MKFARVAVLGIALLAGLAAAWLALNLSNQEPTAPEVAALQPAMETVDVLVASQDIPLGSKVDRTSLEWRDWPAAGSAGSYITRADRPDAPDQIAGTIAKSSFFAGEPITEAKLVHTDSGFMSAILPAGKRAIATTISAETGAGGFILPNDHVDVIMTRMVANPGGADDKFVTETILRNIRVLAIDQQVEDKNGEKVVVGQTATLELTPQQAEILTVAQRMGDRLALSLRSIADTREFQADGDAVHLIGGAKDSGDVTVVKGGVAREISPDR